MLLKKKKETIKTGERSYCYIHINFVLQNRCQEQKIYKIYNKQI